jgi:long-subunit fatty acid transport protein
MGAEYQGLKSFADPDAAKSNPAKALKDITYDARSQLTYFKTTPTVAYRFSFGEVVDLSVGVAANLGLASMVFEHSGFQLWEMDLDHMNAAHSVSFESGYDFVWGLRAGVLLDVLDGLVGLGVVYSLESKLPFRGTTVIDGTYAYDAQVKDFSWPAEVGVGVSSRPLPGLLVGFDYRHIFWSAGVDTLTVANSPRGATPPGYDGDLNLPFKLLWHDQDVVAVGVEYTLLGLVPLRAGYNYARSAVGPEGINPLFTAIAEHNLAFGAGLRGVVPGLALDLAFAYTPRTTIASNTDNPLSHEPDNPARPGQPFPTWYYQRVGLDGMVFHVGVGYEF